jgi:Flp pilus assembly protein TadD
VIALAAQHQSNGNVSIAIEQLQRWVSDNPGDVKAREKLAEMYSRNNQLPDAIYQYREILGLDPEHVMALNNLAWHLREDDPRRALELAGRAYRVAPDSGSILDTLAMVQLKNAQLIEARRSIDRALILAPENPEIIFHEAQLRVAEGDTKGAIKALYSLLAQHANFSGRAEAESLLKKLN